MTSRPGSPSVRVRTLSADSTHASFDQVRQAMAEVDAAWLVYDRLCRERFDPAYAELETATADTFDRVAVHFDAVYAAVQGAAAEVDRKRAALAALLGSTTPACPGPSGPVPA